MPDKEQAPPDSTRRRTPDTPDPGRRRFLASGGAGLAGLALGAGLGASPGASASDEKISGRYHGKVVLITGATSGIGEACARAWAREGARVFFCGRRAELGEQVQERIRADGGEATYMRADVRDQEQVRAFVEACLEHYGGLDIAFNNAGIEGPRGGLDEVSMDDDGGYRDVMRTNVDGVVHGMRYQIPVMRERGSGIIVNTGSMLSHRGSDFAGAYAGSKHAVIGLTRSAAAREAANGLRVFSISPGGVETELLRRFLGGSLEGAGQHSPLGRLIQPREIANALLHLTATDAMLLNGDDVRLDGASSAA